MILISRDSNKNENEYHLAPYLKNNNNNNNAKGFEVYGYANSASSHW